MNSYPSYADLHDALKRLVDLRIQRWLHHELFSAQWWLLLFGTFIIPWAVWWTFVDKRRLLEIAFYASVVALIVTALDAVGTELSLWGYRYRLVPLMPKLSEVDWGVMPVVYSLIYQHFPRWRSFTIATLVQALLFAFAFEPLIVALGIYETHAWRHIYSLPIYFAMGLFVKLMVGSILRRQLSQV